MDKDMMRQSITDVNRSPLQKEDMMKPSIDIDNDCYQEEDQTIRRRR